MYYISLGTVLLLGSALPYEGGETSYSDCFANIVHRWSHLIWLESVILHARLSVIWLLSTVRFFYSSQQSRHIATQYVCARFPSVSSLRFLPVGERKMTVRFPSVISVWDRLAPCGMPSAPWQSLSARSPRRSPSGPCPWRTDQFGTDGTPSRPGIGSAPQIRPRWIVYVFVLLFNLTHHKHLGVVKHSLRSAHDLGFRKLLENGGRMGGGGGQPENGGGAPCGYPKIDFPTRKMGLKSPKSLRIDPFRSIRRENRSKMTSFGQKWWRHLLKIQWKWRHFFRPR